MARMTDSELRSLRWKRRLLLVWAYFTFVIVGIVFPFVMAQQLFGSSVLAVAIAAASFASVASINKMADRLVDADTRIEAEEHRRYWGPKNEEFDRRMREDIQRLRQVESGQGDDLI